jgi:hypothetical protein
MEVEEANVSSTRYVLAHGHETQILGAEGTTQAVSKADQKVDDVETVQCMYLELERASAAQQPTLSASAIGISSKTTHKHHISSKGITPINRKHTRCEHNQGTESKV